jgi:hypothetical protein
MNFASQQTGRVLNQAVGMLCLVLLAGAAQARESQDLEAHLCKLTSRAATGTTTRQVRSVRIEAGSADGTCSVYYSKGATTELMGSHRAVSACRAIARTIRSNLEASRWSCRAVASSRSLLSAELSRTELAPAPSAEMAIGSQPSSGAQGTQRR